jgi:L,D-transpeptidase catalytic domain
VIGDGRSWRAAGSGLAIPFRVLALCALLFVLALVSSATARARPDLSGSVRLSNERTFTRWAHPKREASIRKLPNLSSRRVARAHYLTEDGLPEVYLVLRRWRDPNGLTWLRVRIPMRPNGRTGWIRDTALGRKHLVRTHLIVDRRHLSAALYRGGRRVWRSGIGIGKPGTPTPAGRFWIRERLKVRHRGGTYGPLAFGTSAYSRISDWPKGGVVGIHGTNQPRLVPGRPSHGCIRMHNRAITRLAHRMPIGTSVRIR